MRLIGTVTLLAAEHRTTKAGWREKEIKRALDHRYASAAGRH
jgi:hypothetical protein